MTAHPVLDAFRTLQRRMIAAALLRDGSIGVAIGLLIAVAAGHRIVLGTAGALAGCAAAWLRSPREPAAARLLDNRLGLGDRLVTALDVAEQGDAMTRLLLDDAWGHLQGVTPSAVVPMRATAAAGRVAAAVLVALLIAAPDPTPNGGRSAPRSVSDGADAMAEPGDEITGARTGDSRAGANAAGPGAAALRKEATAAQGTAPADPNALVHMPGGMGHLPSVAGDGSGSSNDAAAGEHSARDAATGSAATASPGASAQTGGAGVATETTSSGATGADATTPALRMSDRSMAAQRAEAALERANVPPGLRRYVMTYFLSITR